MNKLKKKVNESPAKTEIINNQNLQLPKVLTTECGTQILSTEATCYGPVPKDIKGSIPPSHTGPRGGKREK